MITKKAPDKPRRKALFVFLFDTGHSLIDNPAPMTGCAVRTTIVLAAVALLSSRVPPALRAQSNQSIYPAYDGYLKNPDGSYTLSFAYFSHNADVVTIPPGPANMFAPSPADRQQPTTFLPGHWRFQCVMVVDPSFDGKLVWTLAFAGTTTGTSQHMLQSNWNLVEGAEELKLIEYAKVPRGVCLNRAPIVRVLGAIAGRGRGAPPSLSAAANEQMSLFGSVHDEGLPRGAKLTVAWKQLSGPAAVKFSDPAAARTHASFGAPGTYELELWASDSALESRTKIVVNVK